MRPAPTDPEIARLLGGTSLRVDPRGFVVVGVSPLYEISMRKALAEVHAPFFVQFFPHEQTIVLAEDEWVRVRTKFPGARVERGYRLVTLEAAVDLNTASYLTVVTAALAEAGIEARVLSSFHHDHLLVPADRLDDALAALQRLIDAARGG
ncbi:MAG: ACT domain-containing protein [Armatimonadota bacterium]|nr:ACT domain-containing protein [Armatimonadota bacterium]MDR7518263.1 ACT domain-containing protein [Armatimonadota bacterium]MDR7548687.1 ACT domain-containing protein [Armatimonadota bacterium]